MDRPSACEPCNTAPSNCNTAPSNCIKLPSSWPFPFDGGTQVDRSEPIKVTESRQRGPCVSWIAKASRRHVLEPAKARRRYRSAPRRPPALVQPVSAASVDPLRRRTAILCIWPRWLWSWRRSTARGDGDACSPLLGLPRQLPSGRGVKAGRRAPGGEALRPRSSSRQHTLEMVGPQGRPASVLCPLCDLSR